MGVCFGGMLIKRVSDAIGIRIGSFKTDRARGEAGAAACANVLASSQAKLNYAPAVLDSQRLHS